MIVERVDITNLYGSLSKTVVLNASLNLLVGINGSGKTSVLNVIDWLTRPNLAQLAITRFDHLSLVVKHKRHRILIEARQTRASMRLIARRLGTKAPHPLVVRLRHDREKPLLEPNVADYYAGLGPEPKELATWNLLKTLPKPVVIALDRTISAEDQESTYTEIPVRLAHQRQASRQTPIKRVQEITQTHYANYRSQVINLNDILKNRLVLAAFAQSPDAPMKQRQAREYTAAQIRDIENKTREHLKSALSDVAASRTINRYFANLAHLAKRIEAAEASSQVLMRRYLSAQFLNIQRLGDAFGDFERQSAAAFDNVRRYVETVNGFLKDSSKQVFFDDSNNELVFRFLRADDRKARRSIENLSSGERQIVTLFTFLAFINDTNAMFIIDEPELSLHPRWQQAFLDAVSKLRPPMVQVILATHSPEIVGRYKDACVVLLP